MRGEVRGVVWVRSGGVWSSSNSRSKTRTEVVKLGNRGGGVDCCHGWVCPVLTLNPTASAPCNRNSRVRVTTASWRGEGRHDHMYM